MEKEIIPKQMEIAKMRGELGSLGGHEFIGLTDKSTTRIEILIGEIKYPKAAKVAKLRVKPIQQCEKALRCSPGQTMWKETGGEEAAQDV